MAAESGCVRAIFGIASLLVVLAVVGLLASRQLKSAGVAPVATGASMPVVAGGNAREQAQQVQDKVISDLNKAMEQGAARREEADK